MPLITEDRSQFIKNKLKTARKPQSTKPPWWNEEAEEINNNRKNLEKNLKHNPSLEQLKQLKDYEIEFKFRLKEIKFNSYKKYTETKLSREANINEVWETVHKFNDKKKNNPIYLESEAINSMHQFISDFCPQTASYNEPPKSNNNIETETNIDIDSPFNLKEPSIAIESCNTKYSPGLDQISNVMLNNTPDNFRILLLYTINEILASGKFPQEWKEFLVMLLPKK